jgi:hypothetical protein
VKRLAYCAPGRKLTAALTLILLGEQVSGVEESQALTGSTDIILVNPEMLELPEWSADAFRVVP